MFRTIKKFCADRRHNIVKIATQGVVSLSVDHESTNMRNDLLGISITKINVFKKGMIVFRE